MIEEPCSVFLADSPLDIDQIGQMEYANSVQLRALSVIDQHSHFHNIAYQLCIALNHLGQIEFSKGDN